MQESHTLVRNHGAKSPKHGGASPRNGDTEFAEQHFFQLGESELRLIPCLAWCPFLNRIIHIFSEDGSGFLHFEEFLNIYSVFSVACPIEMKIRYAWCIYDIDDTGDIRTEEVRAIVLHVLGIDEDDLMETPRDAPDGISELLKTDLDDMAVMNATSPSGFEVRAPDMPSALHSTTWTCQCMQW